MFTGLEPKNLLKYLAKQQKTRRRTLKEKINSQIEHLGYVDIAENRYRKMLVVMSVDTKYAPKLQMHSLKSGTMVECKIDRCTFNKCKLEKGDIIRVMGQTKKPKSKRMVDGTYEHIPNTSEIWITAYEKVDL